MTDTANLALPCIEGSQAQKHVTHNEALRVLDTLVQLAVLDRDLTAPPGSPVEGQRWIVKTGATGAWASHVNAVAAWQDGAWQFSTPRIGWLAYVVDESALLAWNGSAWVSAITALTPTALNNMTLLGVGTTADTTNPFSAKLNNTLFTAKTVAEGGDGNLRYKLSKESAAKTLSFLFQDNFSGRAEIGLTGDDDFHFKVSPDGTTWREAILINKTTGQVSFPQGSASSDLELTLAELSLGVADALNTAQFIGSSGNRFADSFDALTYVNTGAATNLDSGTAGLLKPALTGTTVTINAPVTTGGSGYTFIDRTTALVNGVVVGKIGVYSMTALTFKLKIVKRNAANNYDVVVNQTFSHGGTGWEDCTLSPLYTVPGSGTYYLGAYLATGTPYFTSAGAARAYIASDLTGTGVATTAEDTNPAYPLRYVHTIAAGNVVVTSTALTATSAPGSAKLVARVKEIDSITLNTDVVLAVSRDGGTTYTAFTLTRKFTANSIAVYESDVLDISGQPSGASMKWKLTSANTKNFEVHDVYLYWS